ncbi:hypothetical protein ABIE26_003864 [Pedobacter africanus]|uniref:Uncharacterized protein n=1 Tax=Pedobacter africanus TaxID=151894 RepID=A0ACC6L111_9SPHI|nr:hypothetical protein [Pedobacter africanus]MDR6785166.1 hypothetical protein [Pedobacter africanus]
MNTLDLISRRFNTLAKLAEKQDAIVLTDLRKEFRTDLQNFIVGETLGMKNGKLVIGKTLYKQWLRKIKIKGFDYDIKFQ